MEDLEIKELILSFFDAACADGRLDRNGFGWARAYSCAVASKLAYLEIPEFEIDGAERASLIPCVAYRTSIGNAVSRSVTQRITALDVGDVVTHITDSVVAIAVVVNTRMFLTFRGTQSFYDWYVNVDYREEVPSLGEQSHAVNFHHGFLSAAEETLNPILSKIQDKLSGVQELVICGHSLGGAIAAIFYWLLRSADASDLYEYEACDDLIRLKGLASCYVYGTPRYAYSDPRVLHFHPFHIRLVADLVPYLPLRAMGFQNIPNEKVLTFGGVEAIADQRDMTISERVQMLVQRRKIIEHDIETYMKRIESRLKEEGSLRLTINALREKITGRKQ